MISSSKPVVGGAITALAASPPVALVRKPLDFNSFKRLTKSSFLFPCSCISCLVVRCSLLSPYLLARSKKKIKLSKLILDSINLGLTM